MANIEELSEGFDTAKQHLQDGIRASDGAEARRIHLVAAMGKIAEGLGELMGIDVFAETDSGITSDGTALRNGVSDACNSYYQGALALNTITAGTKNPDLLEATAGVKIARATLTDSEHPLTANYWVAQAIRSIGNLQGTLHRAVDAVSNVQENLSMLGPDIDISRTHAQSAINYIDTYQQDH
jgi:hypothetical protein